MEKRSIYITDGIENTGLSLHYIGIQSAGLGRKFTWFFFSCLLHGKQYLK